MDYDQTWCRAMRGTSLQTLSNLAAIGGMRMRRFDFVAAYLQGELLDGETVYCFAPPGYTNARAPMVRTKFSASSNQSMGWLKQIAGGNAHSSHG